MKENRLVVSWWDKPPLPKALNVYRVIGDIDFEDSKAVFRLERTGNIVKIDTSQLFNISITEIEVEETGH